MLHMNLPGIRASITPHSVSAPPMAFLYTCGLNFHLNSLTGGNARTCFM